MDLQNNLIKFKKFKIFNFTLNLTFANNNNKPNLINKSVD